MDSSPKNWLERSLLDFEIPIVKRYEEMKISGSKTGFKSPLSRPLSVPQSVTLSAPDAYP